MNIKTLLKAKDNYLSRVFNLSTHVLIFVSIVMSSLATLPELGSSTREVLAFMENFIVALFSLEYLLRIFFAKKKIGYVLSFYGLIDLIAILPFYISSGLDLRSLRIFRFVHLFQLMKLVRYHEALRRLSRAFVMAKEEIILFSIVATVLLYLSAMGIYHFENEAQPEAFKSIFHSLWWALATLTTVGYGDIYPITLSGKIFTFVVLMIGLGMLAVPAGSLASALLKIRMEEQEKK